MFCVYAEITGQGFGFFSGYLTKEGNISDQMLLGEDPEEGKAEAAVFPTAEQAERAAAEIHEASKVAVEAFPPTWLRPPT
jgi:hypothetical protein